MNKTTGMLCSDTHKLRRKIALALEFGEIRAAEELQRQLNALMPAVDDKAMEVETRIELAKKGKAR